MIDKSLSEWEQKHIHVLTSRQMGAWLGRRENRLLDRIRAEIEQMSSELTADGRRMIRRFNVLQIIDKYKVESEGKE